MKLLCCILHLGKCGMEVIVEDRTGRRRKVNITWLAKIRVDVPPAKWAQQTDAELQFQDSERLRPQFPPPIPRRRS